MIFILLIACILTKNIALNNINEIKISHVDIYSDKFFGSGNIINHDNSSYIITANHVIHSSSAVHVNDLELDSSVIYKNSKNDIAILKLKENIKGIKYKFPKQINEGDSVHYWCKPNASPIKYYKGSIARVEDNEVIIDGYAWMGCSGSVVFNNKNEVIGIISGILYIESPPTLHENSVFVSVFKEEYFGGMK